MKRRPIGLTLESAPAPAAVEEVSGAVTANPQALKVTESGSLTSMHESFQITAKGIAKAENAGVLLDVQEDELETLRPLGAGSFGTVNLVRVRTTGQLAAMKELRISDDEQSRKNIYREIKASIELSAHPFVVKTYNIYAHPNSILHILLEFCGYGSSQDLLKRLKSGRLTENGLAVFIIDTLRALAYLHDTCKIIHRDIKSANILVDEEGRCKLADFGVASSVLTHDEEVATKTFAGSLSYMSPERIQNQPYTFNSDIWSMGLTYVELVTGRYPYDGVNSFWDAMNVIVNGNPPLLKEDDGFSPGLCDLVAAMLEKDPAKRMSAAQLLKLPFCKKYLAKEEDLRKLFVKWIADNVEKK
ncbi:Kinase, STE STE7 [Giardia muris]|uniref:mitogen-activated protein kinase kinase n=1 Tax=Giardia muris TaxID=5742 RepID=A0A4Z1SSQ3_GIAMU|nr:Kinase, STE STE7 [Giardia muris]|eukprot:TNJ26678.1 Kinase, STE STE7 [Giardia muris]